MQSLHWIWFFIRKIVSFETHAIYTFLTLCIYYYMYYYAIECWVDFGCWLCGSSSNWRQCRCDWKLRVQCTCRRKYIYNSLKESEDSIVWWYWAQSLCKRFQFPRHFHRDSFSLINFSFSNLSLSTLFLFYIIFLISNLL